MVKLSVIMPVYNSSEYLTMSLNSIINQTIDDVEVICIDDGSTDNSPIILEQYGKEYDFIKIIRQENSGPSIARNNGIKEATGEYIAFLDSDDIYLDNTALEKMYNLAKRHDANMVTANLRQIKTDGTFEEEYDFNNVLFTYFTMESVIDPTEYGIPWAFYKNIYKTSFLNENNITFPDKTAGEDPLFLAKILTKIDEIPVLNLDFYGYNHSASGGVNIKVNTYLKKNDYITHFLEVFRILDENNFRTALSSYKTEFINYLNFRQNIYDEDIQKILKNMPELDEYFKEDDYGYLIIDIIRNPPQKEDMEEYDLIKKCLFEESILEKTYIDTQRLKDFTGISEEKINDTNSIKSSYTNLKEIEKYTFEQKRTLSGKIGKLQKEIKHFINSNNAILTSNSWKLTSYLRSLKHKL